MENKNKIRWGLIIVVLFVVSLAVDFFFLHILFQEKMKDRQQQKQSEALTPKSQNSGAVKADAPVEIVYEEPVTGNAAPSKFQENTEKCLGSEYAKNPTQDDLIRDLEKNNPVVKTEFQLENTHIQLPDGSERRLQLMIADSTQNKNSLEFRYFKLDSDGLPERIPLKPEQTINPRPEFIASLKKQGKEIYHQIKETKSLKDGTSMILTTVNQKAYEFQIFAQGKTLSCREMSCVCR